MGVEHAVDPIDAGVEQLLAQVRRGVDQDAGAAAVGGRALDQDGAAPAPVLRIGGVAMAPAEPGTRHAAGKAAAEDGDGKRHAAAAELRGTLLNRRKKFSVVWRAISSVGDAARRRQHLGGLDHIGRLVALAAEFAGGEIRRVGLDQDAVGRQSGRDGAQLIGALEGQDPRERDMEPERDRGARELGAGGEAMQHGGEGALPCLLGQDARHVGIGLARMDDQRQAGLARRGDVAAEAGLLGVARAEIVVIVEPGLAERHHLGMAAAGDEVCGGDVEFLMCVMRMRSYRAVDIGEIARRSPAGDRTGAPGSRW